MHLRGAARRALAVRLPALQPTFMTVFLTKIYPQSLVVAVLLAVSLVAIAQGPIAVTMQTTGPPVVIRECLQLGPTFEQE